TAIYVFLSDYICHHNQRCSKGATSCLTPVRSKSTCSRSTKLWPSFRCSSRGRSCDPQRLLAYQRAVRQGDGPADGGAAPTRRSENGGRRALARIDCHAPGRRRQLSRGDDSAAG